MNQLQQQQINIDIQEEPLDTTLALKNIKHDFFHMISQDIERLEGKIK